MKLFPDGDRVFEVISRYDDLVTLEGRQDYEPGDTLALILPFLTLHNISDKDIAGPASTASFTGGAEKLVSWLQSKGWKVFCITTTYEPYALHLTQKLGIYSHHVACTTVPWNELRLAADAEELELVKQAEADILTMKPDDDDRIKQTLDRFFREKLPATRLGEIIKGVKPMGGRRKLAALERFADKYGLKLSGWVVVGDSITDFRMLEAVEKAGGLAIAFNANEYALPYATMSLASTSLDNLAEVLEAWRNNQRKGAEKVVRGKERGGGSETRGYFHWLSGTEDLSQVTRLHKEIRRLVREEAAKLG
jgi:energy-converting hydrogenase A subunit R